MFLCMSMVSLPPDLQRFAEDAVASGRYRDVSDLVAAGVGLLQRQEQARAELLASVLAAKEEAEREGCVSGDEMLARVRARLAEKYGAAV
jgi:putative addiction module CopG family antidote